MIASNIEISRGYRVLCKDCDDVWDTDSVADAEEWAAHHINDDVGDENPRPYLDHVIEIWPVTTVRSV